MAKPNCKCKTCGKEYHFCLKCNKNKPNPLPNWHINYCDENCKKIFDTVVRFNCGSMTQEEADKILSSCDTSKFASFDQDIKDAIKKIQKKDKPKTTLFGDEKKKDSKDEA